MLVAAWVRHAVAETLKKEGYRVGLVNAVALGHDDEEQPGWRLSYLPLPTVGHAHADGRIRRVMITGPADQAAEIIQRLAHKFQGLTLTEDGGKDVCRLVASDNEKVTEWYTREGTNWQTVSPIILHGHNATKGLVSNRKTERLLLQAFGAAGFDPGWIEQITFQPAPFLPNTGGARGYSVPVHLKRWPRYHVSVSFRRPVRGPVTAGLGRHYGIGTLVCSD
jgi:CRISPR-associated protein Csb2